MELLSHYLNNTNIVKVFINIIVWIALMITVFVLLYKPKSRLARSKNIQEILENSKAGNSKYLRWFNPFQSNEENRLQATITMKEYWTNLIIGLTIAIIFFIVILQIWYALPIAFLIGFATPSFRMYFKRRQHKNTILAAISVYISTTANLSMTFGNPITAYKEILKRKYIGEPMLSDIERLVLMVESNIPLDIAFSEFEKKYGNNSYLKLFHQNLIILSEKGGDQSKALFSISADYDAMLSKRHNFFNEKQKHKSNIYVQAAMALSTPIIFLVLLNEYYQIFLSSSVGKLVLLLSSLAVIFSVLQAEREVDKDIFQ
ncbi:hypothetical protein ACMGD3_24160 [Lysinibacillus sphaericus]|uniref:hypothetical protein n=1 Tax=Lysinibacillus sphaericus TaxID=1421 RepID=UPI003F793F22